MSKKPERVPVDADYVLRIAQSIDRTFAPHVELSRDQRREAITQLTAFVLLAEKRFDDLGLKMDERAAVVGAALRIFQRQKNAAAAAERALAAPFVENAAKAPPAGPAEVIPLRVATISADRVDVEMRPPGELTLETQGGRQAESLEDLRARAPYCAAKDGAGTYCRLRAEHETDHDFSTNEGTP